MVAAGGVGDEHLGSPRETRHGLAEKSTLPQSQEPGLVGMGHPSACDFQRTKAVAEQKRGRGPGRVPLSWRCLEADKATGNQ